MDVQRKVGKKRMCSYGIISRLTLLCLTKFVEQMESIIRHCFVMNPKEFVNAGNDGDDVFLCEYEYDIQWHNFKRIAEIDNSEDVSRGWLSST